MSNPIYEIPVTGGGSPFDAPPTFPPPPVFPPQPQYAQPAAPAVAPAAASQNAQPSLPTASLAAPQYAQPSLPTASAVATQFAQPAAPQYAQPTAPPAVTQFTQPSLPTAPAVATQFTQPPAPAPSAAAPQYLDPRTSGSFPDPFGQPEPPTIPAAPIIPVPPIIPIQVEEQDAPRSSRSRGDGPQGDPELKAALQEVLLSGASDLHLTSNAPPMIRIDGGLRPIEGAPVWSRDRVARAIASILSREQLDQFEEHLELDLAYTLSANARFRVNVYQQRGAIGGAFRIIPTGIKPLTELGMPPSISRFAELARGLVLVTGPTGSGKSTTLAALIDLVNRTRADHIVTVEDPIEFLHENHRSLINQREVGSDTHSFGNALKHVLRQDPDVILIGELRDLETISVALTAAETGHLVFATLHTQDASQTIDRVIDVFPPHQQGQVRAQLAATLQGVVCQTLVKRAGGSGRAVATEVMVTTPAIANLIREGKTFQIPSAMQAGRSLGMHTMDQHLAELVNAGIISQEAAFEKAHDADGIKRLIQRVESPIQATSRAMSAGSIDFGDSFSGV